MQRTLSHAQGPHTCSEGRYTTAEHARTRTSKLHPDKLAEAVARASNSVHSMKQLRLVLLACSLLALLVRSSPILGVVAHVGNRFRCRRGHAVARAARSRRRP